jgi:hypothetical protein
VYEFQVPNRQLSLLLFIFTVETFVPSVRFSNSYSHMSQTGEREPFNDHIRYIEKSSERYGTSSFRLDPFFVEWPHKINAGIIEIEMDDWK